MKLTIGYVRCASSGVADAACWPVDQPGIGRPCRNPKRRASWRAIQIESVATAGCAYALWADRAGGACLAGGGVRPKICSSSGSFISASTGR